MNNVWTEVFLGIIALATLITAVVHLAVFVAAWMVARHAGRLLDRVEAELTPIFGQLNAIARDAARAASLAGTQVERADRLFADVAERIEQILATVQNTLLTPAREGRAILSGLRAAFRALVDTRAHRRRAHSDDDDDARVI